MFARETLFSVKPPKIDEMRKLYQEQIIPEVKAQKGCVEVHLLEPTKKGDEFISLTVWQTKADAEKYEKSGKYQELVEKLKPVFSGKTVLKEFEITK